VTFYKTPAAERSFIACTSKERFGASFAGIGFLWDWHDFPDAESAGRFVEYAQSIGLDARPHSGRIYGTVLPIHPHRILTRDAAP
jgi:hypothetical protein